MAIYNQKGPSGVIMRATMTNPNSVGARNPNFIRGVGAAAQNIISPQIPVPPFPLEEKGIMRQTGQQSPVGPYRDGYRTPTVLGNTIADALARGIPVMPQKITPGENTINISGQTGSPGRTTVATPDPEVVVQSLFDELYPTSRIEGRQMPGTMNPDAWNMPQAGAVDLGTDLPGVTEDPMKRKNPLMQALEFLAQPETARALGMFAQAIGGPESVGGRLGAFGEQMANTNIERNVLDRLQAGEQLSDIKGPGTRLAQGGLERVLEQYYSQQERAQKLQKGTQDIEIGEQTKRQNEIDITDATVMQKTPFDKWLEQESDLSLIEHRRAQVNHLNTLAQQADAQAPREQNAAIINTADDMVADMFYQFAENAISARAGELGLDRVRAMLSALRGPDGKLNKGQVYASLTPDQRRSYDTAFNFLVNSKDFGVNRAIIGAAMENSGGDIERFTEILQQYASDDKNKIGRDVPTVNSVEEFERLQPNQTFRASDGQMYRKTETGEMELVE